MGRLTCPYPPIPAHTWILPHSSVASSPSYKRLLFVAPLSSHIAKENKKEITKKKLIRKELFFLSFLFRIDIRSMAEQENAIPCLGLFPIILGVVGSPTDQDQSERFVLLNPLTQSMVVLHGGAGLLSAVLGGAMTGSATGGPPPASKASIEALKVVDKEEEENEEAECVVCLEKLFEKEKDGAVVKEMPCGHRYHGECIEKWLHMHGSCPMCRYNMPQEEVEGKRKEEERVEGSNGVWVRISFERSEEGAGDHRRSESD